LSELDLVLFRSPVLLGILAAALLLLAAAAGCALGAPRETAVGTAAGAVVGIALGQCAALFLVLAYVPPLFTVVLCCCGSALLGALREVVWTVIRSGSE